jgi:hypothetical protein
MDSSAVKGILLGITLIIAGIAAALIIPQLLVSLQAAFGGSQPPLLLVIGPLLGIILTVLGIIVSYKHYNQ